MDPDIAQPAQPQTPPIQTPVMQEPSRSSKTRWFVIAFVLILLLVLSFLGVFYLGKNQSQKQISQNGNGTVGNSQNNNQKSLNAGITQTTAPTLVPKINGVLVLGMDKYSLVDESGNVYKQLNLKYPSGRASSGRISPNKKYFVYETLKIANISQCPNPANCPPPQYGLDMVDLSSNNEVTILPFGSDVQSYAYWSPNSKYIIYSESNNTYLYNVSSGSSQKVTDFHIIDTMAGLPNVSWLSDNSGFYISDGTYIYFFDLQTNKLKTITTGDYAQVSYDKKYLAIDRLGDGIYILDLTTNSENKVTTQEELKGLLFSGILYGTHNLVYSQIIQAHPGAQNPSKDDKFYLYLYNADTKQKTQILSGIDVSYYLSPDGSKIAYQDFLSGAGQQIYFLNVSSGAKSMFRNGTLEGITDWQ